MGRHLRCVCIFVAHCELCPNTVLWFHRNLAFNKLSGPIPRLNELKKLTLM